MFSAQDIQQIEGRGGSLAVVQEQIQHFVEGFPFLNVIKAATLNDGLIRLSDEETQAYADFFDKASQNLELLKFVPASGAASRMFKALFEYMEIAENSSLENAPKAVQYFFDGLKNFAFYKSLKTILPKNANKRDVLENLLTEKGLNYGNLPKGLLEFHQYQTQAFTPAQEHLFEGGHYANANSKVCLHFTVSPEHRQRFEEHIAQTLPFFERIFQTKYKISFSEQKASTDTIAVNLDNTPFRNADGDLLFRPAGHGALLENLNDQNADVIFIKNIDNVVPEHLQATTILYKKALAGVLLNFQEEISKYQHLLKTVNEDILEQVDRFLETKLCVLPPVNYEGYTNSERIAYQRKKLNRPLRVCGMVKNVGEPGGGPFWAKNADGTVSLQIVESAQIDIENTQQMAIFKQATHFNPVDLICAVKNTEGQKFNLLAHRDMKTGFITQKSQSGKDLKAQELPGLWNGSMADWNTVFVEVPLITFNPVKTVNDLLREEHQPAS